MGSRMHCRGKRQRGADVGNKQILLETYTVNVSTIYDKLVDASKDIEAMLGIIKVFLYQYRKSNFLRIILVCVVSETVV